MSQNLQLGLLVLLIVVLYLISSRWQVGDETQRRARISFWIGLGLALLLLALIALMRAGNA